MKFLVFRAFVVAISFLVPFTSIYAEDPSANVARDIQVQSEIDKLSSGWEHESSLGVTLNGGNSDSRSLLARQTTSYSWSRDLVRTAGHYLWGHAGGTDVARNWDFSLRYEHFFTDRIAGLAGVLYEGDVFAGIDDRASADLGGKVFLIGKNTKEDYLVNEVGYRLQYEERVPGQNLRYLTGHFARVFLDGKITINPSVYARAWFEILPNFSRWQHYLINFEPSLGVMLTKTLSVKLAFTGRFDGLPSEGKRNFDYIYTTSLVANY